MHEPKTIAIIIVNWNGWRDTLFCLESVFGLDNADSCLVIVCDNSSTDNSVEKILAWARGELKISECDLASSPISLPSARTPIAGVRISNPEFEISEIPPNVQLVLIETGSNLGFAGANNIGINTAIKLRNISHVWLLNNDAVANTDALSKLLERYERDDHPEMIGSTLLYFSEPHTIQAQAGGRWNPDTMSTQHIGGGKHVSDALPEVEVESIMEYVVGASMLVSLSLIRRVGLMDEQLFLYFEELDWALRAGPGLTLGYARGSVVYHREGASSGINSDDARSLASFYYFSRNRKLIVEKFWPDKVPRLKRKMVIEVAVYMKRRQFRRARILGYILAGKAPPEFDRDRSSAS